MKMVAQVSANVCSRCRFEPGIMAERCDQLLSGIDRRAIGEINVHAILRRVGPIIGTNTMPESPIDGDTRTTVVNGHFPCRDPLPRRSRSGTLVSCDGTCHSAHMERIPPSSKAPAGGGCLIAGGLIAGAIFGMTQGHASLSLLVGGALGLASAVALWLSDRRR